MNPCEQCKHFDGGITCQAPQLIHTFINPITGERTDEQTYRYCDDMRKDGRIISFLNGTCGEHGRWFEAKHA